MVKKLLLANHMRKQKETFIKMWCLKSSEKKNYHHKKIMKKFQIIAVSLCKDDLHNCCCFFFNVELIVAGNSVLETVGVSSGVSVGISTGCLFQVCPECYPISDKCYLSIPPENIIEPKLFWCFQGI